MTRDDELDILKVAYANSINDLARLKSRLQQAEDTLYALSELLRNKANILQAQRIDNPGTGGSGGG